MELEPLAQLNLAIPQNFESLRMSKLEHDFETFLWDELFIDLQFATIQYLGGFSYDAILFMNAWNLFVFLMLWTNFIYWIFWVSLDCLIENQW